MFADVAGYRLALDRAYDLDLHLWVLMVDTPGDSDGRRGGRLVRVGVDPLGVEINGTLAQLAFAEPGRELTRGEALGTLEAEKFVGPVLSPVSGTVVAVNRAAVDNPGLVHRDPLGAGWLVEIAATRLDEDLLHLSVDPADVIAGFEARVRDYRVKGVLAE